MENIIITNQDKLNLAIDHIINDGLSNLRIISDFDRTLTKAFVNGQSRSSLLSILRDENYLTANYPAKAQSLFDHYHSIEIDPQVDLETKKSLMLERWTKHFQLLIDSGLTKNDIQKAMRSENIQFRDGVLGLFDLVDAYSIPLVILSASGLGYDGIYRYLKNFNKLSKYIHIVSNTFHRDRDGNALEIQKPIIHSFNKDARILFNLPFYHDIKNKKNIILLGDTIGDANMIDGFEYKNLIKIGFLNDHIDQNIQQFSDNYDIIITNDGSFAYVIKLIKNIISKYYGH